MALIKIFTEEKNREELFNDVGRSIKLIGAAVLNVASMPTALENIETIYGEGVDLARIDYILEVIAAERPNQQTIAEAFIDGLNRVYPSKLFSLYFNNILEAGMANTLRPKTEPHYITLEEAVRISKEYRDEV